MHSYEERILAVELYYRYGKKASVVVMELGYPSTRQLSRWVGRFTQGIKAKRTLFTCTENCCC